MAGKVLTQLIIEGVNKTRAMFNDVNKDLDLTNKALEKTGSLIAGALTVGALSAGVKAVASTADAYQAMNARLRLATGSQEEFNQAMQELQRIAYATGQPVEALVTLYGRISRPLKEAGRNQQDILKVTEAVSNAFRVSGASAEEAENGVIQFGQALGAGALRGDEFNSVAEQAPRLMQALADGIGVPVSALKSLASEGKLTASVVTDALIGQLPKLTEELNAFGDSVSKEWTAIEDVIRRGIGNADTGPLVESLKELREVLADPTTQKNLTTLASAMVKLAAASAEGGSGVVGFTDEFAYSLAKLTTGVSEFDRVDQELKRLRSAKSGTSILDAWMSDKDIDEKIKEFEEYRKKLELELHGISEDAQKAYREQSENDKVINDARREASLLAERSYAESLKSIHADRVKDAESALKTEQAAESRALSAIDKIRKDRLSIEKRYADAIAQLQGGGGGDPSYGMAQSIKQSAADALQAGDAETAQKQAQKALEVLLQLQQAGENTYGFTGFAKQLQQIELAANDLQQSQADTKLEEIQAKVRDLADAASQLKDIKVSLNLSPEEIEQLKTQLQALSDTPILIPVQLVPTGEMNTVSATPGNVAFPTLPGYATGTNSAAPGVAWVGEKGPELVGFNGGERVLTAMASDSLMSRLQGLSLPEPVSAAAAAAVTQGGGRMPDLGRLELGLGGETVSLYGTQASLDQLIRLQRLKRGGTKTR